MPPTISCLRYQLSGTLLSLLEEYDEKLDALRLKEVTTQDQKLLLHMTDTSKFLGEELEILFSMWKVVYENPILITIADEAAICIAKSATVDAILQQIP
jgi:hypothetical protein